MRIVGIALMTAAALAACASDGVPTPYPKVPATSTDAQACARLRDLGCPEATPKRGTCEDAFAQARTLKEADIDLVAPCVVKAAGVADVRMCGGPGTLTFACAGK